MEDYNILLNAEFFGPDEKYELILGPILATFLDREGKQWFAFEVAEIAGVHIINAGSRFFIAIGTEEELAAKERSMR